jgi:4-hydroxy-2-oxoheptanedioate aldolase
LRKPPDGTEVDDAALEAAIQQVIAAGKKTGTQTGMHTMSHQEALQRAAQGMQFIAVESELRMMTERSQEVLIALRPGHVAKDVTRY